MKNVLMFVASVAMAVALTGCGGSPKGVAENFIEAIYKKDAGKAIKYIDTNNKLQRVVSHETDYLESLGKKVDDEKLGVETVYEEYSVSAEESSYYLRNGKKYSGEKAKVTVRDVKGKAKKPDGWNVELVKVDGSWKVTDFKRVSGLDIDSKEVVDREYELKDKAKRYGTFMDAIREFQAFAKKMDGNGLPEDQIKTMIKEFRTLSSRDQDKMISDAQDRLRTLMRDSKGANAAEAVKDAAKAVKDAVKAAGDAKKW